MHTDYLINGHKKLKKSLFLQVVITAYLSAHTFLVLLTVLTNSHSTYNLCVVTIIKCFGQDEMTLDGTVHLLRGTGNVLLGL